MKGLIKKARLRYLIRTIATAIIFIAIFIIGIILITAPDKAAREKFGDGTCQSCGNAKYETITIDRNGYTIYECPECYDQVRLNRY